MDTRQSMKKKILFYDKHELMTTPHALNYKLLALESITTYMVDLNIFLSVQLSVFRATTAQQYKQVVDTSSVDIVLNDVIDRSIVFKKNHTICTHQKSPTMHV